MGEPWSEGAFVVPSLAALPCACMHTNAARTCPATDTNTVAAAPVPGAVVHSTVPSSITEMAAAAYSVPSGPYVSDASNGDGMLALKKLGGPKPLPRSLSAVPPAAGRLSAGVAPSTASTTAEMTGTAYDVSGSAEA